MARSTVRDGVVYRVDHKARTADAIGYRGEPGESLALPESIMHGKAEHKVTAVGPRAFAGAKIRSLSVPKSVASIGLYAFAGCCRLESATILGALHIGAFAFDGCRALRELSLPACLQTIGGFAFCSCSALKEITFPPGVKRLPLGVLDGCAALEAVYMPAGVEDYCGGPYSVEDNARGAHNFRLCYYGDRPSQKPRKKS